MYSRHRSTAAAYPPSGKLLVKTGAGLGRSPGTPGNGNPAPNQQGNVRLILPNQPFQNRGMPQGQVLSGALIGRIGPAGQPFVIGASFTQPRGAEAGRLYLQIAPSHWGNDNATGVYRVKVKSGG